MVTPFRSLRVGLLSAFFTIAAPVSTSCAAREPAPGVVAAAHPAAPRPAQATPPSSSSAAAGISEAQQRDLDLFAAVLENPTNPPASRRDAAGRLLRMQVEAATAVLARALASGDGAVMMPVIDAMTAAPRPAAGLLDPAVEALRTCPDDVLEPLAVALSKYENDGLSRVAALALDATAPVSERLGAVQAIRAFSRRESVDRLLELVDPVRNEDETIRTAAFASLNRLAPVELGTDYDAWRDWWDEASRQSPEEWQRELLRQRAERIAQLEQGIDRLAERYVDLLRALYRNIEDLVEEQTRLLDDIDDELAAVRRFAMERIARLARDSERIDEPLKDKVVALLDDPEPTLRLRAARLLDDLNYPVGGAGEPALADLIAERLGTETDRQVLQGFLELLARRPTSRAVVSLEQRLVDPQLGDRAADALWHIVADPATRASLSEGSRQAVRAALAVRTTPALARLLAAIGDDEDLMRAVDMLDAQDPALRGAVAEGLSVAGRRGPLLDRADDPAVYPWALLALARGPADLENFRALVALAPRAEARGLWAQRVREMASRLPAPAALDADRVLATLPSADDALRAAVLSRAATAPPDALTPEQRVDVLERLAPLLIRTGEALRAFELLEGLNGEAASLRELKFQAALAAGRFEAAARIHAELEAWLAWLEALAPVDTPSAVRLRAEVQRRFADAIDADAQARLERLDAALPVSPLPEMDETETGSAP